MYRFKTTGKLLSDKEYLRSVVNEVIDDLCRFDIAEDYDSFLRAVQAYMENDQDVEYIEKPEL